MPRLLAGMFYNVPRIGLTLWFTYLASSIAASALALFVTGWALLEYFNQTWGADSIELDLLQHFGLWVLVAITGIIISLLNLRAEPLLVDAGIAKKELLQTSRHLGEFAGNPIRELTFPVPLAFVARIHGTPTIVISDSSREQLSEAELDAMYWHEVGHIKGRHNFVNAVAKWVALLTPTISASKVFLEETKQLTELLADRFAKRHASKEALQSARAKFLE